MKQKLVFTDAPGAVIDSMAAAIRASKVFVIADTNTAEIVVPKLAVHSSAVASAQLIVTPAGDDNKNLDALSGIWQALNCGEATRSSLVINAGGGMVCDMGGFAAATFKRGLRFVNVPTTLLAAVDASVGGKTGINFNGCKNEVGAFAEPEASVISNEWLGTLAGNELMSGYAEMLKHGLLSSEDDFAMLLDYVPTPETASCGRMLEMIEKSVEVKRNIVENDFREQGLRKALNLGHTVGHALESMAMNERKHPVPHGYAVAWGMVAELVLSSMLMGFPSSALHQYSAYVKENYGTPDINCEDYPTLLGYMAHDKKNVAASEINFTLLSGIGCPRVDCVVDEDNIKAALDISRDLLGI